MQFDLEFEVVPILLGVGGSFYQNSALGDNCFWADVELQTLSYQTRLTKNIAQCGNNLRDFIAYEEDWTSLLANLTTDGLKWLTSLDCRYNLGSGANQQHIDILSGSLAPTWNAKRQLINSCLGSPINNLDVLLSKNAVPVEADYDRIDDSKLI